MSNGSFHIPPFDPRPDLEDPLLKGFRESLDAYLDGHAAYKNLSHPRLTENITVNVFKPIIDKLKKQGLLKEMPGITVLKR